MDSFHSSILAILGSVMLVGAVLLTFADRNSTSAVSANAPYTPPYERRNPIHIGINYNCPSGTEYCTENGCECPAMTSGFGASSQFKKQPLTRQSLLQAGSSSPATGAATATEGIVFG